MSKTSIRYGDSLRDIYNIMQIEQASYKGWKVFERNCEVEKRCFTCYHKLDKHSHQEKRDDDEEEECDGYSSHGYSCMGVEDDDLTCYICGICNSYYVECENKDCESWCNLKSHSGHYCGTFHYVNYLKEHHDPFIANHGGEMEEEWFENLEKNKVHYCINLFNEKPDFIYRVNADSDDLCYEYFDMNCKTISANVWSLNGPDGGMGIEWYCSKCHDEFHYCDK